MISKAICIVIMSLAVIKLNWAEKNEIGNIGETFGYPCLGNHRKYLYNNFNKTIYNHCINNVFIFYDLTTHID